MVKFVDLIPESFRLPLGALGTVLIILVGTFTSPQSEDNTQANRAVSLFGLLVFISVFYATSNNRKMINWHTVIVGMLAQFILALFVLRTQAGVSLSSTNSRFRLCMSSDDLHSARPCDLCFSLVFSQSCEYESNNESSITFSTSSLS